MRELKKSKRKLLGLAGLIVGVASFVLIIVVSTTTMEKEGIPLAEAKPMLSAVLMLLMIPGMMAAVYGGIYFFMPDRGRKIVIDNMLLSEVKAFDSKYQSTNADGLINEIKQKLDRKGLKQLGEHTQTFWRATAIGAQAFHFANAGDIENSEKLIEEINAIWNEITKTRSQGKTKAGDIDIVLFFPMPQVSDANLKSLVELREKMAEKTEAIINLCFYDLSEKRAYATYYEMNSSGVTLERNGAFIQNMVAGTNRLEIAWTKKATAKMQKPVKDRQYVLGEKNEFVLKTNNVLFICCTVFAAVLLLSFGILLAAWISEDMTEVLTFFCIFVPTLLMPGLAFFYFSLSTYKKITVSHNRLVLKRVFGTTEIFSSVLTYAERFCAGVMMRNSKVFVIFPKGTKIDENLVFSDNNYKKYVIVKFDGYNKSVLEKLFG